MTTRRAFSMTILLLLALAASRAGGQAPPPAPVDPRVERGATLYRVHCASCHGKEGKGDGPLAPVLRVRPVDLTGLARHAGGTFPETEVEAAIDGRNEVRSHGTREMPVWGMTFMDPSRDTPQESEVTAEIRALVLYLRSLQVP